ncbi:hypothetical protein BDW42DRAFT_118418 [Aspergillus taichungensis]|uniref:Uncharacterized protein n=1 Tax=Aspergillus taichungensis TaxID=482145 RepID=A0A2J5HRI4_9EURO|nr:hypothetical protein BDW42DRAFT_118418 [Aspergillus taichungensis]
MQQSKGPEPFEIGRAISRSRSTSMSSDSTFARTTLLAPPPASPPPSFVTASAASQIVTADQEFNTADFVIDNEENPSGALVTSEALGALNGFLDHLLYNILAAGKSAQLAALRPAVAEVLKPRLAREVVSAADDELSEYLGGPEDEHLEFRGGRALSADFDIVRAWKLTRLRCMVYTRLGDMEEDDEEEFIEKEGLGDDAGAPRRFGNHVGNITPAAAIFLTAILEYIAEQALVIAGETARSRLSAQLDEAHDDTATESGTPRASIDRLVVADHDMEKLALNPTLGRLWRTWRKRIRTPTLSRAISKESIRRRTMQGPMPELPKSSGAASEEATTTTTVDPAMIPLPLGDRDVQEIEGSRRSHDMDRGEVVQAMVAHKVRPHSLMVLTLPPRSPCSSGNSPITPMSQGGQPNRHVRARSLPNAAQDEAEAAEQDAGRSSPTASEERRRLETMYEHEEEEESGGEESAAPKPAATSLRDESTTETSAVPEAATTSSLSGASVEVVTSQAGSTDASSAALSDRIQPEVEAEVIEGHGQCEKPKLVSMQRPKRMSTYYSARQDQQDETSSGPRERVMQTVIEIQPATQGAAVDRGASQTPDTDLYVTDSSAPPTAQSTTSEVSLGQFPRPLSLEASDGSRIRPKPAPLALESHHQHGRSSPSVASSRTERAAVQRVPVRQSPAPSTTGPAKLSRSTSVSSSREKRPLTAESSSSQRSNRLRGLSSLRARTSSDTSRYSETSKHSANEAELDDLIRSDETIHYTLTPKSVREMDFPDFTPRRQPQRSTTADLADFLKNTAPPGETVARPQTSKSSEGPKHTPIMPRVPSQPRPGALGQDAKAGPSASTRDSANYKATGPDAPASPSSGRTSFKTKSNKLRRFSDATELSRKLSSRPASATSNPTARTPGPKGPKLQARSAATSKGDETSDLIDFIREGPPTSGAHRIPRTVAPFRDTMDSDDLQSLEHGATTQGEGDSSATSTRVNSMTAQSTASTGSRTGPVESSNRTTTQSGPPKRYSIMPVGQAISEENPFPARTQRRVRDPYAIDLSDEDEELEELLMEGAKPPPQEESLADFLRNAPPPADTGPPQPLLINANAAPPKSSGGMSSASSMRSRILRSGPTAKSSRSSLRQQPPEPVPVPATYATKVGMERTAGLPTVSERKTETGALADFLRNTGPPEPPANRSSTYGGRSKDSSSSSLSRFLSRRKKVEA